MLKEIRAPLAPSPVTPEALLVRRVPCPCAGGRRRSSPVLASKVGWCERRDETCETDGHGESCCGLRCELCLCLRVLSGCVTAGRGRSGQVRLKLQRGEGRGRGAHAHAHIITSETCIPIPGRKPGRTHPPPARLDSPFPFPEIRIRVTRLDSPRTEKFFALPCLPRWICLMLCLSPLASRAITSPSSSGRLVHVIAHPSSFIHRSVGQGRTALPPCHPTPRKRASPRERAVHVQVQCKEVRVGLSVSGTLRA